MPLQEDCHKPAGVPHHLVSARLVAWEAGQITPLAQVRESIGQAGEIETETAAILAAEGIEEADFSQVSDLGKHMKVNRVKHICVDLYLLV